MEPCDKEGYMRNTRTNRFVKIGSIQYKKLLAEQVMKEQPTVIIAESNHDSHDNLDHKIKQESKKVLQKLAKENKKKLEKSKDPEADLRQMLYEKLMLVNKPKKSTRYKFFVSSDEEDDSEYSE